MSKQHPTNIAASVRQRLLNHATKTEQDFQWAAFIRRTPLRRVEEDLAVVVADIRQFLSPAYLAAASASDFTRAWQPNGPWEKT